MSQASNKSPTPSEAGQSEAVESNQSPTPSEAGQSEAVDPHDSSQDGSHGVSQDDADNTQQTNSVPPCERWDYPWFGTWEEARETASYFYAHRGNDWTVAMDLVVLEIGPKYRSAQNRREKIAVFREFYEKWRRWGFSFEPTRNCFIIRYEELKARM